MVYEISVCFKSVRNTMLCLVIPLFMISTANATCYLISYNGTRGVNDNTYIDPAYGTNASWPGSSDTQGTAANMPGKLTWTTLLSSLKVL
jgi:hypothetical protein